MLTRRELIKAGVLLPIALHQGPLWAVASVEHAAEADDMKSGAKKRVFFARTAESWVMFAMCLTLALKVLEPC
jgi:hypothetical protein